MESTLIILAILAAAVLGKANTVALAASLLLTVKLLGVAMPAYGLIEKYATSWGLVLLVSAVLVPLARGDFGLREVGRTFTSFVGILAFALSLLTTYLSGQGLQYLTVEGHTEVMPVLILGAVLAAAFLRGVPVGPLITAGLLSVAIKVVGR